MARKKQGKQDEPASGNELVPRSGRSLPVGYVELLEDLKARVRTAQLKAAVAANRELVRLYWDIGRLIVERQEREGWGKGIVDRLARDLQQAFPGLADFSPSNVSRMRALYLAYTKEVANSAQAVPNLVSAVDDLLRHPDDKPSIGLILCRTRDRLLVEYALRDLAKPIGIAEWQTRLVQLLPEHLQGSLVFADQEVQRRAEQEVQRSTSG
jgi:hypothetical protein